MLHTLAVLGSGSWGTALAIHLARCGHTVTLWGRNESAMTALAEERENKHYLPGIKVPDSLGFEHRLDAATRGVSGVIVGTPCESFPTMLESLAECLQPGADLVWACKGITNQHLLHEVVDDKLGTTYSATVISGPSFAAELARGLPTAVTVASAELTTATRVSSWFHHDNFRAYPSDDIIGVQVAGALKNVFAIASGVSDGLGFGANARSALITRGLAELMRLGASMGARSETLMGLSGVGDLVLTCTDDQSRNRRYGLALGQGLSQESAIASIGQVVEGINTCRQAMSLAELFKVDMPITREVYQIVHESKAAHTAVESLLNRAAKPEADNI